MDQIALNFFPLLSDDFTVTLYRLPFLEGERPSSGSEQAVRRMLEVEGERRPYWTLFQQVPGGTKFESDPAHNIYATLAALRMGLIESCRDRLESGEFSVSKGIRPRVEIVVERFPEGLRVVTVEPYYLREHSRFGFLADFRFHPKEEFRGTTRARQLSLSLDSRGRSNQNHYADRYSQIMSFVRRFHHRIFPITLPGGQAVDIDPHLEMLDAGKLDVKHYIMNSNRESRSQFMGISRNGPLEYAPSDTRLCFLYRPEDRSLSHDLFRALRGDTFQTFNGMQKMFQFPLTNDRVSGIPILGFNNQEIESAAQRVKEDVGSSKVVPIVITPFSRHDDIEDNEQYWVLKHAFLSEGMPLQVVARDTVRDKNKLKWSTAGIGLQVFAKAGGTPWKVRPRTERCLIVGVGQAHRVRSGHTDSYFAYSVLTDSSGVFETVRTLGKGPDENTYIADFHRSLRNIFDEYSDRFSNFVIHSTFSIRRRELEAISDALEEHKRSRSDQGEFVSLRFNDRNGFCGFAVDHNSRVPYESSMVSISRDEFLVWFEGLQYEQRTVGKMIANPLHVKFTYPHDGLTRRMKLNHLQDAVNLSGANWRGFNAKAMPVSVYYAQLIAKYLKEFEAHNLPAVDVDTLTPWFL